jgi:hypothetical protein
VAKKMVEIQPLRLCVWTFEAVFNAKTQGIKGAKFLKISLRFFIFTTLR